MPARVSDEDLPKLYGEIRTFIEHASSSMLATFRWHLAVRHMRYQMRSEIGQAARADATMRLVDAEILLREKENASNV